MPLILSFSLFIVGAIVGSFLNVVGLRWNSGSTLKGRSFCFACRKKLSWWELIPLLSYLALRGRCSECRQKISWQYPIVEFATGLIFLSVFREVYSYDSLSLVYASMFLAVFSIYVVIVIYDIRHKIIPDNLVYASVMLATILHIMMGQHGVWDWLAGPIIFAVFGIGWLVSQGRAVGLGDAKLGLSIGILLGAEQGASAIVLAFWIGTVLTLSYMLVTRIIYRINPLLMTGKKLTIKSEIPFGPFLALGAWIAFVYSLDLLYVASL